MPLLALGRRWPRTDWPISKGCVTNGRMPDPMVRTSVLFDTCILIDYLRGVAQARAECNRYADRAISIITRMEVLAGATPANEDDARIFLSNFQLLALTLDVADRAAGIRRTQKIKLPDAIILATAEGG